MQATTPYNRTFSGSIGAGFSLLMGSSGRQYYTLEHKTTSRYHRAGETQDIIIDQVELGRDPRCQVRYDESFATVSRRHAAIVRDGSQWKLINLSETNPTFLNGNRIASEWFLQSGDEIQLSVGGPKIGFIIPNRTTGSLGAGTRLRLFGEQALRPYRNAIIALSVLLVLAIAGMTFWKLQSDRGHRGEIKKIELNLDSIQTAAVQAYIKFQQKQDSLHAAIDSTKIKLLEEQERNKKMKVDFEKQINSLKRSQFSAPSGVSQIRGGNKSIDALTPYVYFIYTDRIECISPDGERNSTDDFIITGTGFMLADGRFVTARHVVEPWFFPSSPEDSLAFLLNYLANNGGKVILHLNAISSSGDRFSFTNEHVDCNRKGDVGRVYEDGSRFVFARRGDNDWAYVRTSRHDGLAFDGPASNNLQRGVQLTVLGFPYALGANAANDIEPIFGNALTAKKGLDQGVILTTNSNFEHGNSGGPAFYRDESGNYIVVGIISRGAGRSTGFIVPISAIN